ncbi:Lysophospholipase L2 [Sodalis praecaptivus]|uniref:Lysophospholipase L2 n=1 Tax=Sodalis praecaptivus TaxID=1239307 RepID=W0HTJ3_9GAMM|nr:lysophospholipase L2 [Sodalis praecaptivus]AHF75448.1 Lysophospholipase L2 [Sodalis praecaptivus]
MCRVRNAQWLTRERQFAAFSNGELLDFWRGREEGEFAGAQALPIRFVRFCAPGHDKVVVISTGRIESYVKYPEVAYDLFHCGYDVMIIDHRGQGLSGRLLADSHRGHVLQFADYVSDFARFWQRIVQPAGYRRRFALAHSMGGAILALFLAEQPDACHAAALCAPMFGLRLPMPRWLAWRILEWAELRPSMRDRYAVGTGAWRPRPFTVNMLTHSDQRYRRNLRYYADYPELQLGGPTYHWVREGILAGEQVLAQAGAITTPVLLMQAGEDKIVDNRSHRAFCQAMALAGHPCENNGPITITGARHEILFETDPLRAQALTLIADFFMRHH